MFLIVGRFHKTRYLLHEFVDVTIFQPLDLRLSTFSWTLNDGSCQAENDLSEVNSAKFVIVVEVWATVFYEITCECNKSRGDVELNERQQ